MPATNTVGGYSAEDEESMSWSEGFEASHDPRVILMQQMDAVADYLAQARAAHRSPEEIANLAQNLADLEAELTRLSAGPVESL